MSRVARNSFESKFFHIMVQGIGKEKIFEESIYKEKYVNNLIKEAEKYKVEILAYCIMNNHAHILIYIEEIASMTKMMQSLNTKFAIYYNKAKERCGYVFRDRFKSECISTQAYLENCVRYIHNNPVEAGICEKKSEYKYSTYNQYVNKNGIINDNIIKLCFLDIQNYMIKIDYEVFINSFIDIEDGNSKKENLANAFDRIVKRDNIKLNEINDYKIFKITNELLDCSITTKKEVANLLEISDSKLSRIMKKWQKNEYL